VGREWIEGEPVRAHVELQTFPERGLWVSARRFDTTKAFQGFCPAYPHGETKQGPLVHGSTPGSTPEKHIGRRGSHSGVPVNDNGTSEVETVRRRLDKARKGSRRVSILGAKKAPVTEVRRSEIG